jgi:hypothetical protein
MFEKRVAGSVSSGRSATLEATAEATAAAAVGGGVGVCVDSGGLVDRLVGLRAQAARREAEMLALMVEFVQTRRLEDAGSGASMSEGFAVDELALALVSTRHRVRQQLDLAAALGGELSATGALLAAGVIDAYQAWVIFDMNRPGFSGGSVLTFPGSQRALR